VIVAESALPKPAPMPVIKINFEEFAIDVVLLFATL
jgi:hypothetical protein